jgi:thioredoxin-related protein
MEDSKTKIRFIVVLAALCSVVFCAAFVSLFAYLQHRGRPHIKLEALKEGAPVPPISAYSMTSGKQEQIAYDVGRPTLLYVFSPKCHWCEMNRAGIEALSRSAADRYRIVGLALTEDGLAEKLKEHPVDFPVYTRLAADVLKTYKLGSTPQTIVVSPQGKVLKNWPGAYMGRRREEVQKYFAVSLPEIKIAS